MSNENDPQKVYLERYRDICQLVDYLNQGLIHHAQNYQRDIQSWGYAGDLGHVRSELLQLTAFVSHKEPGQIEERLIDERPPVYQSLSDLLDVVATPAQASPPSEKYTTEQRWDDLTQLGRHIKKLIDRGKDYLNEEDYGMAVQAFGDVVDLRGISLAIKANQLKTARRLTDELDTAPREEIPTRLYDWIYGGSEDTDTPAQ